MYLSCQLSNVRLREAFVVLEQIRKAASVHVLHDNRYGPVVKECLSFAKQSGIKCSDAEAITSLKFNERVQ